MEFLAALSSSILCIIGGILILLFVGSMITIASALSDIAKVFTKWVERR
jgi:hypothetical protein